MSIFATSAPSASVFNAAASNLGGPRHDGVVEISLLLPTDWADDLVALSKERGQSVGQILRSMIGQALQDAAPGY
jgi:hypothetical protein